MFRTDGARTLRARSARWLFAITAFVCTCADVSAAESRCFGTPSHGRIDDAVSFPLSGTNFSTYSTLGWSLGRAYVHDKVLATMLAAFRQLEHTSPATVFVYGETGWQSGGSFEPHRTHQNGLSVDLMVPVLLHGTSVPLPGGILDRYGYDLEFDHHGRHGDHVIDFEALAELLYRIDRAADDARIGITRVIFDVPLQKHLWQTTRGLYLREHVTFSTTPAWVRHDEHVHIDFAVRCAPL